MAALTPHPGLVVAHTVVAQIESRGARALWPAPYGLGGSAPPRHPSIDRTGACAPARTFGLRVTVHRPIRVVGLERWRIDRDGRGRSVLVRERIRAGRAMLIDQRERCHSSRLRPITEFDVTDHTSNVESGRCEPIDFRFGSQVNHLLPFESNERSRAASRRSRSIVLKVAPSSDCAYCADADDGDHNDERDGRMYERPSDRIDVLHLRNSDRSVEGMSGESVQYPPRSFARYQRAIDRSFRLLRLIDRASRDEVIDCGLGLIARENPRRTLRLDRPREVRAEESANEFPADTEHGRDRFWAIRARRIDRDRAFVFRFVCHSVTSFGAVRSSLNRSTRTIERSVKMRSIDRDDQHVHTFAPPTGMRRGIASFLSVRVGAKRAGRLSLIQVSAT